jgi:hypothetical protein
MPVIIEYLIETTKPWLDVNLAARKARIMCTIKWSQLFQRK